MSFTVVAQGDIHQGSAFFSAKWRGWQCTINATITLAYSVLKKIELWTGSDLNLILFSGDNLYKELKVELTHPYLMVTDLPRYFILGIYHFL